MNYSEIDNINDNYNNLIIKNENNNIAKSLLSDYEILKENLKEMKNNYKKLINQKETYDNYINNLLNNHMNIINIINNFDLITEKNNLSECFNEYQFKIKENYDKWIINYYLINIKNIEENIEQIETTLKDFTNLFLYIINNIVQNKEIEKNTCPICFENTIDICFNPCGHTSCNKCVLSNRINNNYINNKCYTCRSNINEYIKIYFSI